jgi:hypothetical protein
MAVPDIHFISRKIQIADVAGALDLKFGANGNIHCWRPELHQNGDRTASVGVWHPHNKVKCFGCGIGPLGPIDLVMSVLGLTNPGAAARWIAERFTVPELPPGKHVIQPERNIFTYGLESDLGLLVHSGLWADLSPAARALVPVLLEHAQRDDDDKQRLRVTMSYRALARFSGAVSHNPIAAALHELEQIHWLTRLPGRREPGSGPVRSTSTYLLTPRSDALCELANANFKEMRDEIEIERNLRAEARAKRRKALFTK